MDKENQKKYTEEEIKQTAENFFNMILDKKDSIKSNKMPIFEYAKQMPDGVKYLYVLKQGRYFGLTEGSLIPIHLQGDLVHHIIEKNGEYHIICVDEELFIPHKIKFEMDMPRCCGECPFAFQDTYLDITNCQFSEEIKDIGIYINCGKPQNCPLLKFEKVEDK